MRSATKDQMMTMKEIEKRFDAEWVLVGDPVTDDSLEVRGGRVLCHDKDRDKVYRETIRLRPKKFAMLYLGKLPGGTAIVL